MCIDSHRQSICLAESAFRLRVLYVIDISDSNIVFDSCAINIYEALMEFN